MNGHLWRILCVVGPMVAVALVLGAAEADKDGFFGQVPAAWVQAVGSVAAILGAMWIAGEQSRRDDKRRAADHADYEFRRLVEALESIIMLIKMAERARDTAKALSAQLKSGTGLEGDYLRVYRPLFSEMRADVDSLLALQPPGSGVRVMAFNFRSAISQATFAIGGAVSALDLGHEAGREDFGAIHGALDHAVRSLDSNIDLAKVMQDVWLEGKLKEDEKRKKAHYAGP